MTSIVKSEAMGVCMSDRKANIRNWITREMESLIRAGNYTGPQRISPKWFRPNNELLYNRLDVSPPPSIEEITDVLNMLIAEKKLYFDELQAVGGKIEAILKIP